MTFVEVDPADPTPVYEQLRAQIALMIAAGTLPAGGRLPTIRQLAADLGLAKGTVARAYELLERDGYVEADGRRGTVVSSRPTTPSVAARDAAKHELARLARQLVLVAGQAGLDAQVVLDVVHDAVAAVDETAAADSKVAPGG